MICCPVPVRTQHILCPFILVLKIALLLYSTLPLPMGAHGASRPHRPYFRRGSGSPEVAQQVPDRSPAREAARGVPQRAEDSLEAILLFHPNPNRGGLEVDILGANGQSFGNAGASVGERQRNSPVGRPRCPGCGIEEATALPAVRYFRPRASTSWRSDQGRYLVKRNSRQRPSTRPRLGFQEPGAPRDRTPQGFRGELQMTSMWILSHRRARRSGMRGSCRAERQGAGVLRGPCQLGPEAYSPVGTDIGTVKDSVQCERPTTQPGHRTLTGTVCQNESLMAQYRAPIRIYH